MGVVVFSGLWLSLQPTEHRTEEVPRLTGLTEEAQVESVEEFADDRCVADGDAELEFGLDFGRDGVVFAVDVMGFHAPDPSVAGLGESEVTDAALFEFADAAVFGGVGGVEGLEILGAFGVEEDVFAEEPVLAADLRLPSGVFGRRDFLPVVRAARTSLADGMVFPGTIVPWGCAGEFLDGGKRFVFNERFMKIVVND